MIFGPNGSFAAATTLNPYNRSAFPLSLMSNQVSSRDRSRLIQAARAVSKKAYAPYSKFKVGAALLTKQGQVYTGCNVENSSYGLTNCAERTAIFRAIADAGPKLTIRAVAVLNAAGEPCSPCGACRQVIYEFGPDATIFFPAATGWKELHITELLPEGFRFQ
jgi:cytidine deaminase